MKYSLVPIVLLLAACAAAGPAGDRQRNALERQLAERSAGEPRRCISAVQGVSLSAVDSGTVVYDTPGTLYVSRLTADCPSLRPDSAIIVESYGDQYCEGDRIRALDPGGRVPGPLCRLGDFTPYRARR